MLQVTLHPGLPNGPWACLRPLCGHDEAAIHDADDLEATRLLDRLLVEAPGTTVGPGAAWSLTISDRDRLLVALYRHHYGDRVEGAVRCGGCGEAFDLTLGVDELSGRLEDTDTRLATGPDGEGAYLMPDGRRFRLPTPEDQRRVLGLEPGAAAETLLRRCLLEGDVAADRGTLEAAMEAVGPVLDVDLVASCPECGAEQTVRFDIRVHLMGALASERRWLAREVHSIATAYGWSLEEILALMREDRRAYVQLIEADRTAAPRS